MLPARSVKNTHFWIHPERVGLERNRAAHQEFGDASLTAPGQTPVVTQPKTQTSSMAGKTPGMVGITVRKSGRHSGTSKSIRAQPDDPLSTRPSIQLSRPGI